jgi:hypothetical protein
VAGSVSIRIKNRIIRFSALLLIAALYYWVHEQYTIARYQPAFMSGWLMLGLLVFLTLFNVRKKLSYLPLGNARIWAQLHYYAGLLLAIVFLFHIDFHYPTGVFENILFYAFVLEILTGLYGIYISRALPKRFSKRGEYLLFERMPQFREAVKQNIEALVSQSIDQLHSTAITEFYSKRLLPALAVPQNFWLHVFDSNAPYTRWDTQFDAVYRYMDDKEIELTKEIKKLFYQKLDMDYQRANQAMLKYWLFVHIPLSYGLLVLVVYHLLLTYSFSGGL